MYYEYDATKELTQVTAMEMLRTLSDYNRMMNGNIKLADASVYLFYSGKSKTTYIPRFVMYAAHAENVAMLLSVFDYSPIVVNPPPSSSIHF